MGAAVAKGIWFSFENNCGCGKDCGLFFVSALFLEPPCQERGGCGGSCYIAMLSLYYCRYSHQPLNAKLAHYCAVHAHAAPGLCLYSLDLSATPEGVGVISLGAAHCVTKQLGTSDAMSSSISRSIIPTARLVPIVTIY